MLFVERSNRTERLLEGLSDRLMARGRDPLAPSFVVVQGPGMERWLAQSIAREHGVLANVSFPFPRQLLERVLCALPEAAVPAANPRWEGGRLVWSVARQLAAHRDDPDFAALARHLHASDADWRLVQLARRLANLLDQYITFRPDWVAAWTAADALPEERDERWQAKLYRAVRAQLGPGHFADRAVAFCARLETSDRAPIETALDRVLPGPVEVFAVSTLPPIYLSVLDGLARLRDVHLSVLSPSPHYWADLWHEVKQADSLAASSDTQLGLFAAGPPAPAAALLAGLGRLGGDFQRVLEESAAFQESASDRFEAPAETSARPTLLERLQTRLLTLEPGEPGDDSGVASDRVARDDDSVRVHLCHGPRRELEVVESLLRDFFERDETLAPEDVIVMAPDIDAIAADIESVFAVAGDEREAIPYRIADRGAFRRSPVAEAFRDLLVLLTGRATRGELLDWLACEPVRSRFELAGEDVEALADWAERAGVRFGLDEAHREALGLAPERSHTLAGGLDRLALAHAVGASSDVFAGRLPEPLDVLVDASVLGALGDVEAILSEARREVAQPRPVPAWCAWLRGLLERAFAQDDANAHEHVAIREALAGLAEAAAEADFGQSIPFEAIREQLAEAFAATPSPQAFLAGGVTFCELVPLRAIPFRVIVVLGLADGAFPRGRPAPGFDLMARGASRAGDRTTRSDDRYLFLEALLSARDKLVLSVPAMDLRDGSDVPPSVVIQELLDALAADFELEAASEPDADLDAGDSAARLRRWLQVSHPLQSSSPRYFEVAGDVRLIGMDPEAYRGAAARRETLLGAGAEPRRFLASPLDVRDADRGAVAQPVTLTLDALVARLLRSTRGFARERLAIGLPRLEAATDDLDPSVLEGLDRWSLGNALLSDLVAGEAPGEAEARLRAHPLVPAGVAGGLLVRSLAREAERLAAIVRARCSAPRLEDRCFSLDLGVLPTLGPTRLEGHLDRLWPDARIDFRMTRLAGRAELEVWIRHLVLCALADEGASLPSESVCIGRPESNDRPESVVCFGRVEAPLPLLARLVEWAASVERAPLPFFPRSSRVFARRALAGRLEEARRQAYQEFEGGDGWQARTPESEEDLDLARIWEGLRPLAASVVEAGAVLYGFEELAIGLFEPLFAVREVHRT